MAITPGGRVGDATPLGTKGPRKLTDYTREIAHALLRAGHDKSSAIAIARAAQARWARGGGKVRPQVRAAAAASTAEQHALDHVSAGCHSGRRSGRGKRLSEVADDVDLAWLERLHPRGHGGKFVTLGGGFTLHAGSGEPGDIRRGSLHVRASGERNPVGTLTRRKGGGWLAEHRSGSAIKVRSLDKGWKLLAAQHTPKPAKLITPKVAKKTGVPRMARFKAGTPIEAREQAAARRKAVAAGVIRQQEIARQMHVSAAERDRETARRLIAGQALSPGTSRHPRRGTAASGGRDRGSAFRALLAGSRFSFSEDEQATLDLVLAEALDRDLVRDLDFGWTEALHPRDWHGRFGRKGGGAPKPPSEAMKARYERHLAKTDKKIIAMLPTHSTDRGVHGQHYTDEHGNDAIRWNEDRAKIHRQIVDTVYRRKSKGVPKDRQVHFLGGAPGAGKTTGLEKIGSKHPNSIVINPDDFKAELAQRGLVPQIKGMSPMEASAFVHEESSRMAEMLADRARKNGHNVTMDITMSSAKSVGAKLSKFHDHGYTSHATFFDIPHALSKTRVHDRHMRGTLDYWHAQQTGGSHLGQRLVPSSHVQHGASTQGRSSSYRDAFEAEKQRFGSYDLYNNDVSKDENPILLERKRARKRKAA